MATASATKSNGSRFRSDNDRVPHHVPKNDVAPEWGNQCTCVACWTHGITDLERHRRQSCDDWNALNRINTGFVREFNAGMAPPHTTQAYILSGEHHRMVKGRWGIQPHHIMRWQNENWGPYSPLDAPPDAAVVWRHATYHQLLLETLRSLPVSIAVAPRQCTCSMALLRSRNGTTHSYNNEKNSCDEFYDQKAVGNFMAAQPFLINRFEQQVAALPLAAGANVWQVYQPARAVHANQPLAGHGDWVELAPPGRGICGEGQVGISQANVRHFQQFHQAVAMGNLVQHANLHQGKTILDVRRGNFAMPGTPRR